MLKDPRFHFFTPSELSPRGWLRRQLEIEAEGLCGNLDRVWPDIRDSRWIGGSRDGWERVPYWLDGFVPLAYLLDNDGMKTRAKRYVDAILAGARPDGWLCPCEDSERGAYDMWGLAILAKALTVYADCSGDGRIEGVLLKAMRSLRTHIDDHPLFKWAAARWYEFLIPLFWLYERTGEEWLLDLAFRVEVMGFNYKLLFERYRDTGPERHWNYLTHVVNLAMCLKSDALSSRMHGGDPEAFAEKALSTLLRYHGTAAGHFSGDECTAGTSPVQGTELCSIVEAMYSYETLLSVSGGAVWGDRLERLAFNSLPATLSPDMWSHQYDQLTNQPQCSRLPEGKLHFTSNGRESHLFGLEPNFGCCTANFGQGWPKLALSAFMRSEKGIVSAALVPSELSCEVEGRRVSVRLDTEYPFRGTLTYTVETSAPVAFDFSIRIPGCAASARVGGADAKPGDFFTLSREWEGTTEISVELAFQTELVGRPSGLYSLRRGPLLYSAAPKERWERIEYERDGVERKYPYCDYEIFPESPWNYAFASEAFELAEHPISELPFSPDAPPVTLRGRMARIPWELVNGVASLSPQPKVLGLETVDLIPYGCTNLRMTELPKITEEGKRESDAGDLQARR